MLHLPNGGEALLDVTMILRVDVELQLIRTRFGDDYIRHDSALLATYPNNPYSSTVDCGLACANTEIISQRTSATSPSNAKDMLLPLSFWKGGWVYFRVGTEDDDDICIVKKVVREHDQDNLATPVTNPNCMPQTPLGNASFEDSNFMDSVDVRENTLEKL